MSKYFMLVILLKALDSGYWSHLRIHRQKNTPEVSGKAPQAVKKNQSILIRRGKSLLILF